MLRKEFTTSPEDLKNAILNILLANAHSLSVKDLQSRLRTTNLREDEIMRILRSLADDGLISRNHHHRWHLKQSPSAPTTPSISSLNEPIFKSKKENSEKQKEDSKEISPWAVFRRLCLYYMDCLLYTSNPRLKLTIEEQNKSWLFLKSASFKETPGPQNTESLQDHLSLYLPANLDNSRVIQPGTNRSDSLFFGYPCALKKTKEEREITPLFVQPMEIEKRDHAYILSSKGPIMVNQGWLESIGGSSKDKKQLCELLELSFINFDDEDSDSGTTPNETATFPQLVERLKLLNLTNFRQSINLESFSFPGKDWESAKEGIYNWSILTRGNLGFNKSLYKELGHISKAKEEDLENSALKCLFLPLDEQNAETGEGGKEPIATLAPLSPDQKFAVGYGLTAPISVITGPPGSGKSEVIRHLLVNLLLNQKSAVFVSRNHQALDAVIPRINHLAPSSHLIQRCNYKNGNKTFSWKHALESILNKAWHQKTINNNGQNLETLKQRLMELEERESRLNQIHDLFIQIDCLQEPIASHFLSLPLQWRDETFLKSWDVKHALILKEIENLLLKKKGLWSAIKKLFFSPSSFLKPQTTLIKIKRSQLPFAQGDETFEPSHFVIHAKKALEISRIYSEIDTLSKKITDLGEIQSLSDDIAKTWELSTKATETCLKEHNTFKNNFINSIDKELMANLQNAKSNAGNEGWPKTPPQICQKVLSFYPLWSLSSLSARSCLPLEPGYFDLVILDEASQSDIPSFIPLLFRSKRAAVVGDPLQLTHISTLSGRHNRKLLQAHGLLENNVQRFSYSNNSAFNLGSNSPWNKTPIYLSNHFRCHPEIAKYANEVFYSSRWTVSTLTDRLVIPKSRKAGCYWSHVNNSKAVVKEGSYAPQEIDRIVDEIKMLQEQNFEGTIGIVTPFRAQANLLQDCIQQSISREFLQQTRCMANTVHGFQGDERDIILFSLGCSFEMPTASKNFVTNNPNLFNVGITRAKTLLHIFGDQEWARGCGVGFIEKMARFCGEKTTTSSSEEKYGSPWEYKLDQALNKAGIKTVPQYPIAGRFLDLAIITSTLKLDIEVDGWKYHTDDLGLRKADDLWRDQLLQSLGWKVCRFWGWQLSQDMEGCVKKITTILNE